MDLNISAIYLCLLEHVQGAVTRIYSAPQANQNDVPLQASRRWDINSMSLKWRCRRLQTKLGRCAMEDQYIRYTALTIEDTNGPEAPSARCSRISL
ncbi:hypothetical protein BJ138DRAFT_1164034 [Hygrophoropsis aurantiaca]|uniref:Uncharacterized protein n=1 Tax=Hygrophoropsis aurantiaca TaxID=72124 RepID=A0ACB7ZXI4_9AGAM|nr:hypothetical protein BJ138DRAFT_1164034 [Hygrophoropsis aurantiaca]